MLRITFKNGSISDGFDIAIKNMASMRIGIESKDIWDQHISHACKVVLGRVDKEEFYQVHVYDINDVVSVKEIQKRTMSVDGVTVSVDRRAGEGRIVMSVNMKTEQIKHINEDEIGTLSQDEWNEIVHYTMLWLKKNQLARKIELIG